MKRSLLFTLIGTVTYVVVYTAPMAAQDDVPLIAEMDIEALLEQELNNLNVHDF